MRVVFMGSPAFALPTLSRLADEHQVVALVCQPDRPAGRGRKLRPPATKLAALKKGIPVLQPERIREPAALEELAAHKPDLIIVAAYGQILPPQLLDLPDLGGLNVHASLLPRWRGASPVQAAIYHGDESTGVTIMKMDAGMDTGPIVAQTQTPIAEDETGGSLSAKLADLGAELLMNSIPGYIAGELLPVAQDDSRATLAPLLKKADGALDPARSAAELARQVRAYDPWPGSFLIWEDRRLTVTQAHSTQSPDSPLGLVFRVDGFPALTTSHGALVLDRVQPSGRAEMPGDSFVNGAPQFLGANLGA